MKNEIRTAHSRIFVAAILTIFALAGFASDARASSMRLTPVREPSVTTLLFHQVSDEPIRSAHGEDNVKHPWLTAAQFDEILSSLQARGYTFVSLRDALGALDSNALHHAVLPAKPLLLTFDDGYASAWTTATPILRKHSATAAMFFEGQLTGVKTGRLTVAQLQAMQRSGVWTLESHGWIGHGNIAVDARGTTDPYWYANLMWLPRANRLETRAEFEERIRADLHHFRATFEAALGTTLDVFAYPSGEFGQNGALVAGGNALTRLEAGHSNAGDLTQIVFDALALEGFRAAFVVSVPGASHIAAAQDAPYRFPRIGVGSEFDPQFLDTLESANVELPEITENDVFADCTSLVSDGNSLWTASTQQPELFRLGIDGRVLATIVVPALLSDRAGQPALISALRADGSDLTVLQKAGWWPGATAFVTHLRIDGSRARVLARTPLPGSLNWIVGAAVLQNKLVAMTDEGRFYDVLATNAGTEIFSIPLAPDSLRHDRFAGPALVHERLYVYDRTLQVLEELSPHGVVLSSTALAGDIRSLGAQGGDLLAVDRAAARRVVRRFRISYE